MLVSYLCLLVTYTTWMRSIYVREGFEWDNIDYVSKFKRLILKGNTHFKGNRYMLPHPRQKLFVK